MGETKAEARRIQGRRIAAARNAAGLTQTALAAQLNISGPTVSMWEAGHWSPTPARQVALAAVLGRDWADLFDLDRALPDGDGEAA